MTVQRGGGGVEISIFHSRQWYDSDADVSAAGFCRADVMMHHSPTRASTLSW